MNPLITLLNCNKLRSILMISVSTVMLHTVFLFYITDLAKKYFKNRGTKFQYNKIVFLMIVTLGILTFSLIKR